MDKQDKTRYTRALLDGGGDDPSKEGLQYVSPGPRGNIILGGCPPTPPQT